MSMLCLVGAFRIVGSEPDGDTVRFYPTDPSQWDLVDGPYQVVRNARGGAAVRLDGIAALETHFAPPGGRLAHQPLPLAHAARDELLRLLGFSAVAHDDPANEEAVTASRPEDAPGYLLTGG